MKSSLPEYIESISVRDFYESFAERLLLRLVTSRKHYLEAPSGEEFKPTCFGGYRLLQVFREQANSTFGAGEMGFLREQNKSHRVRVLEEMAAKRIPV